MENYSFGDDSKEPLYLTNGTCEATHDYIEELLTKAGIPFGNAEGEFYPLTEDEEKFIAEDVADLGDGIEAILGYTSLYKGKKYLMPSVELCFGEGTFTTEKYALDFANELKQKFQDRISQVGGHVILSENEEYDRHVLKLLLPFDYAIAKAKNFDEWKKHLEQELLVSDLTLNPII